MKKIISAALAIIGGAFASQAQSPDGDPIITFKTTLYELYGETNSFTFYLGATENTYVDVDCGFGSFEVEVEAATFDADKSKIQGTPVTCTVNADATVRIWGDASKIDFIDMEGCYISTIDWPTLTEVDILNLRHNQFQALDLTHMTKLRALYLSDNPFTQQTPLVVGASKPSLAILELDMIDWLDPAFDFTGYPELRSFSAYSCPTLRNSNLSNCPKLLQFSVDGSAISQLDLSNNPNLLILNVSETHLTELDLSHTPYLTELYCQHEAAKNSQYKISSLDLSKTPLIQRLYVNGNNLTELDLSGLSKLVSFSCRRNLISELSFDGCPDITLIDISKNYMNYNTMPLPRTTFSDYVYNQYPLAVDRSYKTGTAIDFSAQVIRTDSKTEAALYVCDSRATGSDGSATAPTLADASAYSFDNGILTLNTAFPDSVYVVFKNTAFPDYDLSTSRFMVKSEEDFGKPSAAVTMKLSVLSKTPQFSVGLAGATPQNPVEFSVDFGNGTPIVFTATSSDIPDTPNVSGTRGGTDCIIYLPEGTDLTALSLDGVRLNGLDVTAAPVLSQFSAKNCGLATIDLRWNAALQYLDLSGNRLSTLSLNEGNDQFLKTSLSYIDVSDNLLTSFDYNLSFHPKTLKAANNSLTTLDLTHASYIQYIDYSGNRVSEISLQDCESLSYLNISGNRLSELEIPAYTPLETLDISGNCFDFTSLPAAGIENYTYAPQQPVVIPTKAPSVNLSSQIVAGGTAENPTTTSFEWRYAADNAPVPTGNITEKIPGRFRFTNPATGEIYCAMTNPLFPQFTAENPLTTTVVETAELPTNAIAQITPSADAEGTIALAGTKDNVTMYIDWTGDGDLEQYILKTTATRFPVQATAGTSVKFYSYDTQDNVSVVSIDIPLSSIDLSGMTNLFHIGVSGTKVPLDKITFPANAATTLTEFVGTDNGYTSFALEGLDNLSYLSLNNNSLTEIDLTPYKNLGNFYAASNSLTSLSFDNPKLWEVGVSNNLIESIDLTGAPQISQLWLAGNHLKEIDLTPLTKLKVLTLNGNRFDINTLPVPQSSWYYYEYGNQALIDAQSVNGIVDLSSQAVRNGVATTYKWFIDSPYMDENGNLSGEELYIDEEYTLEGGVTTFLRPFTHIICVMQNTLFPRLFLLTDFMDTVAAGVGTIEADETAAARYFDLRGIEVANPQPGRIYIVRQGDKTTKAVL